ncbi:MAG: acyl-CoA synthetase FdrA [Ardenticatenaceae bacterium]|nr:acyl-CoA synthetase FdrA [Ardenticatenaceae bacterium]
MTIIKSEVRQGAYYDSVVLMQLQKALAELPGVADAGVVMATEANKELLAAGDLLPANVSAKADDLLIVVKGETETAVSEAMSQVDQLLTRRKATGGSEYRPHSLAAAAKLLPEADWVLISVPGRYAAGVAEEALDLGKHVFLYSDNVPLADEVRLKQKAQAAGLLLMGPDCGTAIVNGVGLGFANRVRRGRIGLVAASGTGLQAVSSEIHNLGNGLSQAIGTGGRDLKAEVGAITALQAVDLLGKDPATRVIVLVSKPPSPQVATQLLRAAQATGKQIVVNFIGFPPPGHKVGNIHFATSLVETAELAVHMATTVETSLLSPQRQPVKGTVRGLFSGGTLAYETVLGLTAVLDQLHTNIPIRPDQKLADLTRSQGHTIIDMGEDEFTQGRLHPMMDNDLRLRRLRQETADPDVGFILLDVVLGEGSHPNPAGELSPALAEAVQAGKKVIAIVVGTDEDPQDLNSQIEQLAAAGATVFSSTNEAVDYIFNRLPAPELSAPPVSAAAFGGKLAAINVGLESFYESIKGQGGTAVQVEWRPPAGGNEKLMAILAKMKQKD